MKKKFSLSTTQIIMLGFLLAIAIGTAFLMLPCATSSGRSTDILTALFTSTTSICVTGLVVTDTFSYWSTFGHIVILLLIQLGGIGIVSLTTGIMLLFGKRITLKNRLLMEDYFNLASLGGLVKFLKKMFLGTFFIEAVGAAILCIRFVPEFGLRGIWLSIFSSVSSFCNAGIDIIGADSLTQYANDPLVMMTTSFLIIFGGLGFVVWWDIVDTIKKKPPLRQFFSRLRLHSKVVIVMTLLLLFGGMALIFALEYNNPQTLAPMTMGEKLSASFFQSVTLRTAGFFTISQSGLRSATSLVCILLMFIGGSPIGTAGGIKTTTFAMLIITAKSYARGRPSPTAFRRTLPKETIMRSLTVVLISIAAAFVAIVSLSVTQNASTLDIAYEVSSALATVGLSRSLTASLNSFGQILIIICMYLGRIGPISLILAMTEKKQAHITFPEEDIRVG